MVHSFETANSNIHRTTNTSNQCALVAAKVAKVEVVVLSAGGPIHLKPNDIVEPDEIVEDNYDDWNLKGILTAGEDKTRESEAKMRALEKKFCSVSVEYPTDMLAVVALAEQDARLFFFKDVII